MVARLGSCERNNQQGFAASPSLAFLKLTEFGHANLQAGVK
jgi:hypothetical protein